MIKLVLHFWSGTRTELKFADLASYTNHLLFTGMPKEDFKHFEVFEVRECVRHVWRYIPLRDRTSIMVNFECDDCDGFLEVTYEVLDELYRRKQDH